MTFIVGLKCCDGIILCADSLEEDGIAKKRVNKISLMGTSQWGVAIAGSGGGGIIDKFCAEAKARLPQRILDRYAIENVIEEVLAEFRAKYKEQEDRFSVIVAAYENPTGTSLLYRADSNVLSPVCDEAHIGTGNSLWRFVCDALYDRRNCVEDNMKVAIFATRLAIQYASGVGEPVQAVSYTFGDQYWKYPKIMHYFLNIGPSVESAKHALQKFWAADNPPSRMEQVKKFGGVRTPGDELTFLNGVAVEKLQTVSGRNKNEGFLFGNRDRLHKRALLEQERAQVRENKNQQP